MTFYSSLLLPLVVVAVGLSVCFGLSSHFVQVFVVCLLGFGYSVVCDECFLFIYSKRSRSRARFELYACSVTCFFVCLVEVAPC